MRQQFEVETSWQLFRDWLISWSCEYIGLERYPTLGYFWTINCKDEHDDIGNFVRWIYFSESNFTLLPPVPFIELTAIEKRPGALKVTLDNRPSKQRLCDILRKAIVADYPEAADLPGKTPALATSEIQKLEADTQRAGEPLPEKPPKWGHGWTEDDYFDWWYRRRQLGFGDTLISMGKTAGYTGFYGRHEHYKAQHGARPKPDNESRFKPS